MTDEELAIKAKSGDEAALLELWKNKRGMAYKMGRSRFLMHFEMGNTRGADLDDFMQCGFIALMRAVDSYNPEKPFAFSTCFCNALKTEYDYLMRTRDHSKSDILDNAISYDAPIKTAPFNGSSGQRIDDGSCIRDLIVDPQNPFEEVEDKIFQEEQHEAIEKALEQIPEKQSAAVRLRYYKDKTMREIGESMGLSYNQIRNILKYAFINLRTDEIKRSLEPFIDLRTDFYRRGSVINQTSPVEENVIRREELRDRHRLSEETA